jgi:hypothetical protein
VSKTGWTSEGELLMTYRISLVAVRCPAPPPRASAPPPNASRADGSESFRSSGTSGDRKLGFGLGLRGLGTLRATRHLASLPVTDVTDRAEIDNRLSEDGRVGKVGMAGVDDPRPAPGSWVY